MDAFVTELKQKASLCEFGELKDSLIRDRIVCGIRNDTVRARLLRERELTLQSAIDICMAAEVSESEKWETRKTFMRSKTESRDTSKGMHNLSIQSSVHTVG